MSEHVFEARTVTKTFPGVRALDRVNLSLSPGSIHALLGENGAGKSTLIKIMTGVHRPDTGTILLDGQPVHINNSQEAQTLGIAAIYQEPMIFPDLNVAENSRACAHDDKVAEFRRACDTALRDNDTMPSKNNIMTNLDQVIDFGAAADNRIAQCSTINR